MIKDIFIDVETTGLDAKQHGIIQIAGIIVIDGEWKEDFNLPCNIFPDDAVSDKALEINGKPLDEIRSYADPIEVYQFITGVLKEYVDKYDRKDKFNFIAYNAGFDMDFMRQWFTKNNDKYFGSWFHFPYIDVMGLAAQYLKAEREIMPNFKLGTVANHLLIEIDKAELHDAMYDIKLAQAIYEFITKEESHGKNNN